MGEVFLESNTRRHNEIVIGLPARSYRSGCLTFRTTWEDIAKCKYRAMWGETLDIRRPASSVYQNSMLILTPPVVISIRPVFALRILRPLTLGYTYCPHDLRHLFKPAPLLQRQNLATNRVMAPQLDGYFKQVDKLSESFIERLRKAVAIPSISADEARRPDVVKVSFLQNPHNHHSTRLTHNCKSDV